MKNCRVCLKPADVTCICDINNFYCFNHIIAHLETPEGQHKILKLDQLQDELYKMFKFDLEKINQLEKVNETAKNEILSPVIKIIKDKTLEEKANNFEGIKFETKNIELKKKSDEEKKQIKKKICINKNHEVSNIVKELKRDYKLFIEGHKSSVRAIAITSDNKYIISGSYDWTIRIWNLLEKRQETVLEGHTYGITSIAITSDSKYVISGSKDKTIRIWNLFEKRQETVLEGHNDSITCIAITSDNTYIISGSSDKTIRIWNILKKTQEAVLQGHTSSILSLIITSDNKYIISGGGYYDSKIRI